MRHAALILISAIGSICFAQVSVHNDYSFYKKIDTTSKVLKEEFSLDLDKDGRMDSVKIENLKALEGDPEDFSEVSITFGNGQVLHVKNVSGYFLDTNFRCYTTITYESDRLLVINGPGKATSIVLSGYPYPSCENHVLVISISNDSTCNVVDYPITVTEISRIDSASALCIQGVYSCNDEKTEFLHLEK